MTQASVTIIGGGIAGQAACEQVRALDPELAITLVGAEPRRPYDRVRLSEILVDGSDADELALRPRAWYSEHDIKLLMGTRVLGVDLDARRITLDDGRVRSYSNLVFATGSEPLLPPIPGIDQTGVLPFRGPEDCAAIHAAAAEPGCRAVVIGGGLLGLEAARGIAAQGAAVTVVHLVDRLMERQLDAGAAALLLPKLAALGVEVQLGRQTQEITGDGRATGLRFADGATLQADLVVVSIGIRPQVELARATGLAVERGIVVDDHLATSAPHVYALGECAQHRGIVHGLVAPIHDQARILARHVVGATQGTDDTTHARYEGSIPATKLKVAGIDLVSIGRVEGPGEVVCADADAGTYRKLVVADGAVAGALLLGDIRGHEALLADIGSPVEDPLARLVDSVKVTPAQLPDTAQICHCNGVCKGEITAAVREGGCTGPREVMAMTRAGTGCGSCRPAVLDIVLAAGGGAEEAAQLCPCEGQTQEAVATVIREQGLESVSEVTAACGTGRQCGACKPALAYLVSEIRDNRHREERDARFINDRVHANIQSDGTFSVVPRLHGGVVTPEQLRRIADAAEKYEVRMVKLTGGQRIDLLGVAKADLPDIWRDLDMPSGHAYAKAVRTVKTCVGEQFCRFGVGDAVGLGIEIERSWEGLHTPAKVKAGVSGCPRNCAEATVKDIGVVAVEGGWQVRIGGAAGASVREADLLCQVDSRAEALRVCTVFLQYYREHAEYKERTYDFVPRVGLEEIRRVIEDPVASATLLERFRLARTAAQDPWLERETPYHPRQFSDLDAVPASVGDRIEAAR